MQKTNIWFDDGICALNSFLLERGAYKRCYFPVYGSRFLFCFWPEGSCRTNDPFTKPHLNLFFCVRHCVCERLGKVHCILPHQHSNKVQETGDWDRNLPFVKIQTSPMVKNLLNSLPHEDDI